MAEGCLSGKWVWFGLSGVISGEYANKYQLSIIGINDQAIEIICMVGFLLRCIDVFVACQ